MSASFRKTRRYTKVVCRLLNLCTTFFHQTVRGDQTVHAVSARFRKMRRYTKVVCCVLMIHSHTRFGSVTVRKCLQNGVCGTKKGSHLSGALLRLTHLCTRLFHRAVRAVSARFRKTRRYTKVVCCVLMIHSHTHFRPVIMQKCHENGLFGTKKGVPCGRGIIEDSHTCALGSFIKVSML